jgi:polysaccharide deacetylase 2 family uncharacterized protein YibQ
MSRKKTKKRNDSSKLLTYIAWILSIIALIIVSLVVGYYLGFNNAKQNANKKEKLQVEKRISLEKKLDAKIKHDNLHKTVNRRLKEVLQKESKPYISAAHEIDDEALAHAPKIRKKKLIIYNTRPKLAIIIDDVQTARQVNAIKSLHIPLTMSFLPPRPARPNSAKLASHEKFYMVHLPMEAMHFSAEEPDTLRIHDSQQKISARIAQIKKEFPRVRYINNHTGSKFTANEVAMNRLIFALNANHIKFIDSRTTAKTMAPKVLKNFGLKYVARDVFLDNKMNKAYIIGQIKEAIKVAKERGHCITIGHPHKSTLAALAESKALFKDVDLVQVNKVY